jgi:hypothetical protein
MFRHVGERQIQMEFYEGLKRPGSPGPHDNGTDLQMEGTTSTEHQEDNLHEKCAKNRTHARASMNFLQPNQHPRDFGKMSYTIHNEKYIQNSLNYFL